MNFLRNLFGGGDSSRNADKNALYLYVQPKRCDEIVQVRINLSNDLSRTDDESGFYVRKLVSAIRCPFQAEVEVFFDGRRNITEQRVTDGEFVDEEAFLAQQPD